MTQVNQVILSKEVITMMLEVGMRVRVKHNFQCVYENNEHMLKLAGKIVIIKNISSLYRRTGSTCLIRICEDTWNWDENCFEPVRIRKYDVSKPSGFK